jgi:2-polyprenyl-3-methyl-5-hydroxy-6-metoxy-1,4-benzoquinol methylase
MNCKICQNQSNLIFSTLVMHKYDIKYYKCTHCCFVQTEVPHWLSEAYENAITNLDIGYATRNIKLTKLIASIINSSFNSTKKFIDFGGGYGLFVRIMRDHGFNYYLEDPYCQNIFANYFDVKSIHLDGKFELLTAFEVFEHLENPLQEIDKMFKYSDSILFSTELQPSNKSTELKDWWYIAPETGQHISLYSKQSLEVIAKKYGKNLYSNNHNLHLITNKKFRINPIKLHSLIHHFFDKVLSRNFQNKRSLLQKDFQYIQKILKNKKK